MVGLYLLRNRQLIRIHHLLLRIYIGNEIVWVAGEIVCSEPVILLQPQPINTLIRFLLHLSNDIFHMCVAQEAFFGADAVGVGVESLLLKLLLPIEEVLQ